MTVTVTIYKAEAEATESKKNRRRRDASRRQAFPVCFRAGQFGAHVKGHAPGKRMEKDGMDDYTTRRIRLALLLFCVTVRAYYYYCYYYHYCYCWPARYYLLLQT